MKDEILLWYNEAQGLYFVGNEQIYLATISKYGHDVVNVLYSMDEDQLGLCKKIRDSLNNARSMAKVS